ncbi:MAG TPA: hypothetical protein VNP96_10830 [Solirubrobacterales bacterium]|nr:hypothetical protein [Solirubrobacterales bacterium]
MASEEKIGQMLGGGEGPSTPDETLDDLLNPGRQRRRRTTPIRRSFLQDPQGDGAEAPLRWFVHDRRELALDLFLLLNCTASAVPWDVEMPSMAWARALDMRQTVGSETTVSKNWTWLEERKLIRSERHHRVRKVFMLTEDGSGREYVRPEKGELRGFFGFPFVYFTERWHKELSLPGKAVLLIALSQRSTFTLVTERAAAWYGVSADTLERGLDDLRNHGLLATWLVTRKAPRARLGFTSVGHHRLNPPFGKAK